MDAYVAAVQRDSCREEEHSITSHKKRKNVSKGGIGGHWEAVGVLLGVSGCHWASLDAMMSLDAVDVIGCGWMPR